MFEYIATISTFMGQPFARAGFTSEAHARRWIESEWDGTPHAGRWEITRNGERLDAYTLSR